MKKFSLVLLAMLTAVALIGCGDDKDSSKSSSVSSDAYDNWDDSSSASASVSESDSASVSEIASASASEDIDEPPVEEKTGVNTDVEADGDTIEAFLAKNSVYQDAFEKSCKDTLKTYKSYYSDITFEAVGNEVIYSYYLIEEQDPSAGDQIVAGLEGQSDDVILADFDKLGFKKYTVTFVYYQPDGSELCSYSRSK